MYEAILSFQKELNLYTDKESGMFSYNNQPFMKGGIFVLITMWTKNS